MVSLDELRGLTGSATMEELRQKETVKPQIYRTEDFDLVAESLLNEMSFASIPGTDLMYYYDPNVKHYRQDAQDKIRERAQKLIAKCTKKAAAEVVDYIRRETYLEDAEELFNSKHINTESGILDPETFEVKPHGPQYLTLSKLPFKIQQSNNYKLWRHIQTIINPKDTPYILEILWIAISGRNPYKKMIVFKGGPNTQKTTLLDILSLPIGEDNISRTHPETYLNERSSFQLQHFIGKRVNIAEEIGNLTEEQLERQKGLIGAAKKAAEQKHSNKLKTFDPTRFLFLFSTNKLGEDYNTITDPSVITRYQFLIFKNQLQDNKLDGTFLESFFDSEEDKATAISALVQSVLKYKKLQAEGKIPKTRWSTIEETKEILKESISKDDLYFESHRLIEKDAAKLTLDEIAADFGKFVGRTVSNQEMGYTMKLHGFKSKYSNGRAYFKNIGFGVPLEQTRLGQ